MEARYLRVKNWRKHQHYRDRRPPWIKLARELIDGDAGREFRDELSEIEQWQLVRIWLYASGSERVMVDCDGHEVPVVAYDERTLRIGIRSDKKVAVDKFVRLGFLEPVSADEIDASTSASSHASAGASKTTPKNAVTAPTETDRGLTEVLEVETNRPVGNVSNLEAVGAALELLEAIRPEHRDDGTRTVLLAYAQELPADDFRDMRAQLLKQRDTIRNDGKWVNGALGKIARKRAAA